MKTRILIILTAALFLISGNIIAQNEDWEARMEKIRAEKVAFLTSKLALTSAEAEKFWPIYNEMEKQRWESQKTRRQLESKVSEAEESLSDNDVVKLTREYAGNMQKEGALISSYNEKFLKVLPPKKVLKLYQAENEFRMSMIRKYRQGDNSKGEKAEKGEKGAK